MLRAFVATAAVLLVSSVSTAVAAPCAGFTDVDDSSPFCVNVEWMRNRGITLGLTATLYDPNSPVTRLQMAAFMYRLGFQNAFLQGGNAFGAPATLGTTDGNSLGIQPGGGNVGIGTNTPQSKFNVVGTSWFQGDTTPLAPGAGKGIGIGFPSGATRGYIFAFDYATDTWQDLVIQPFAPGGVGIGVLAPAAKLDVENSTYGAAIQGISTAGGNGVVGTGRVGVAGVAPAAVNAIGVFGAATLPGLAGAFNGDVQVNGTLTKIAGAFRIDHPLDAENKYLSHSFVESPDMKNIYDGVVDTNSDGLAIVELPDWFEALNRDFRYQLTVIGQFAQAIVAREIEQGRFEIRTDRPSVKVSWQVTGIRHDPYANAHRLQVEEAKPAELRGTYIYPEGYGRPRSDGIAATALPRL